eukprot:SAG31_NODE_10821_length_1093_cov_1.351107_1_plen_236_part_00
MAQARRRAAAADSAPGAGRDYVPKCLPMLRSLLWHRSTPLVLHVIADRGARLQLDRDFKDGWNMRGLELHYIKAEDHVARVEVRSSPRAWPSSVASTCVVSDSNLGLHIPENSVASALPNCSPKQRIECVSTCFHRALIGVAANRRAAPFRQNTLPSNFGRLSACSTLRLFAPEIPELAGIDRVIVMDTVRAPAIAIAPLVAHAADFCTHRVCVWGGRAGRCCVDVGCSRAVATF